LRRSLLLAIAALAISIAAQEAYLGQSGLSVEGTVLDAKTNRPLEHARVSLVDGPAPEFYFGGGPAIGGEAVADAEGHFTIQAKPGRYRVVTALEGFVFSRAGRLQMPRESGVWLDVPAGQRVQNVQLRMVKEALITGRVLDAKGQVLPGNLAGVALQRYRYDDYGNRRLAGVPGLSYPGTAWSFVRMDDRGDFRFYGLQPGDYYVSASGPATVGTLNTTYYPGTVDEAKAVPVHVGAGEEIRLGTMTLQPPQAKAVHVRFHFPDDGKLSPNREVRFKDGAFFPITNGPRGLIELSAVAAGHYDVMVNFGISAVGGVSFYSRVNLDVADSDVDQDLVLSPGVRITGTLLMEDAAGPQSKVAAGTCRLRSAFALSGCTSRTTPGFYELEIQSVPKDAYVVLAKASGKDILAEGVEIDSDTQIELLFATPGGIVDGAVKNSKGEIIPDAVVALVPDAPLRGAASRYRSCISDIKGNFELRGIAPGSYRLFAWSELEGSAYRNAEFLKKFEVRGKPIRIEKGGHPSMDLKLVDEPDNESK
jgi:protocatechuate 3,4-dioxygenase beta subunit